MSCLQVAQVPLLIATGRGEYLINGPGLIAKSIVKCVAHCRKNRIGDSNLCRYRTEKTPDEEDAK